MPELPERLGNNLHWQSALRSAKPCVGALKHGLTFALLAVAVIAAWIHFEQSDARLRYPDAFDYAQMGRQLADGHGMTSLQAFPYVLGWLDARGLDAQPPWPVVWRFPLPIALRGAAFRLLGASDRSALLPALVLSALTAPLLFRLGNRLGGPLAGLLATLLWVLSPSQQELALSGLTEPGAALLVVAIAGLALRASDDAGAWVCAGLGAALGLALLQRTNLLAVAPVAVVGVALAQGGNRSKRLAALVGTSLLVASPWLLRNALAFGEPLLNLTSDRGLLRLGLGRDPFYELSLADPRALLRASLAQYPAGWSWAWLRQSAPAMLGREFAWLLPLGAVAALWEWRGRRRAAWALAWSGLVLTALVFAPPYPDVLRFYWPYAALLLAPTCAALLDGARRLPFASAPAVSASAIVALFALSAPREASAPLLGAKIEPPELAWLADQTAPGTLVASPTSHAVAWQAQRPSLRFVGNYGVMAKIDARITRIEAFHLSTTRQDTPLNHLPLSSLFQRQPNPTRTEALYTLRKPKEPKGAGVD